MPPKRVCHVALLAAAAAYLLFLLLFELPSISTSSPTTPPSTHRPHRRELEASLPSPSPLRPDNPTFPSSLAFSSVRFHRPNSSASIDASATSAFAAAGPFLSHLLASTSASPAASPSPSSFCPSAISLSRDQIVGSDGRVMVELPCGLGVGSHMTVVGRVRAARPEWDPRIAERREGEAAVMVSQFMMELVGVKAVQGEDPPRILHFNPRIRGDHSGRPVIEQNTCYRMQWGQAQRCEGWASGPDEETGELRLLSLA